MKKEIKTNFNVKMEKTLKDRFIEVCKQNETLASLEIRKFIKEYLKKNSQTTMFN
jgi:hypothetical protein